MLLLLIWISLAFKANAFQISSSGNVVVEYNSEAKFSCSVSHAEGVAQVTWQRVFSDGKVENLASYNKRDKSLVNEPFKGKVILTEASLTSSSISLKNAVWADESCYVCSFNVYPDGSQRKQMCLKVQGISAMNTSREAKGKQQVLSCTATGKPAPKIEWSTMTSTDQTVPRITTGSNRDGSVTTSSSIALDLPAGLSGQVHCSLNRGLIGEKNQTFTFSPQEEPNKDIGSSSQSALIITVLTVLLCIVVIAVLLRKRLKRKEENASVP